MSKGNVSMQFMAMFAPYFQNANLMIGHLAAAVEAGLGSAMQLAKALAVAENWGIGNWTAKKAIWIHSQSVTGNAILSQSYFQTDLNTPVAAGYSPLSSDGKLPSDSIALIRNIYLKYQYDATTPAVTLTELIHELNQLGWLDITIGKQEIKGLPLDVIGMPAPLELSSYTRTGETLGTGLTNALVSKRTKSYEFTPEYILKANEQFKPVAKTAAAVDNVSGLTLGLGVEVTILEKGK